MGAEISSPFASESAPGPSSMTDEEFRARSIGKMDAEMRKKYARGSKFNFKVVIRGDSASGKSTLLRRLRGGTFLAEYAPTPEIKTAHIPWQARSSPEDVVMLEVWDVVDKARKLPVSESLTLAHPNLAETESGRHTFPLDATMVDVYKGCHAAVFLIDPSKKWTYEYALRQLKEVPEHVPTCVLVNFRDYPASKRVIRPEEVEADCEHLFGHRPFRPFVVETSLLNCYGLQALSTFLHIPFLCLKRASLEQAMQLNTHAIVQAQDALKTVKSGRYDEYERKIERAQGRGDDAGVGAGDNSAAPAGTANGEANGESRAQNPASPEEAAITWEKLSNTTLGEAPILLGAAAVKGVVSGLGAVASATPADIAKNVSENVKSLATLKTIGLGPAEKKGHYDDQERERVAPQFSHLAGRGGAEAAAFGGEDIGDDDLTGPRPGMSGGGEHPDVSAHAGDVAGFFDTPRAGSGSGGESEDERRAPFGAADAAPSDDESDTPARRRDRNNADDDASASPPRSRRTSSGARGVAAHRDWDDDDDGDDAKAPAAVVRWDDDESESDADAPASAAGDASDSGEGSDGGEFRGGSASSKPGASSPKARRSFEGGSIVRQISDQDPFFGAGATAKAPSNVEVLGSGPPRAADLDLDPSAIAASLGTSSAGADAYEQVQDTAEALSRAMSGGVSAASKGSTAGSFGDALEGGSSDESSERRRRRKKKEKKSAEKSAKSSRKSKKAEKEEKPATESASKGKKKKKAVKDWDESDSD